LAIDAQEKEMSMHELFVLTMDNLYPLFIVLFVLSFFVAFGAFVASLAKKDKVFFNRIEERNSAMMDDDVTYSTDEVFARLEKLMRISRKYYSRNTRRGGIFRLEHPVSKRRGQKFLDELTPGLSNMINNKIARQKPGKVVEQKPARGSRYRINRKYRRYFGNNR
jgi:hypothetical protein